MAQVAVLFFGRMADVAGVRQMSREADRLYALRDGVLAGADAKDVRMSVNQVQVFADQDLQDGDEVAFFSVFSGG
ncbi:MoaD/ThiS family protein [Asticcacaulis sp. AC402]|uniref:MoaD/ThiS family protein n=1 Tax=Asticcacaulis sp. AC402 TaxID=1282361 RepID=UPI0003C3ADE8|nr:MoaD/ThiS family protein [Asticcacaulis sp. AC402]ESQ75579.1 hypothetical protein ABAC402_08625 [Asticcacaulis sp. AC402]